MKKIVNSMKKCMKNAACGLMAFVTLMGCLAIPADACMDYQDMICAGAYHTVYLRSDGTVAAFGKDTDDRCGVEDWTDVIAISAESHTVGLRSDGTVYATGCDT